MSNATAEVFRSYLRRSVASWAAGTTTVAIILQMVLALMVAARSHVGFVMPSFIMSMTCGFGSVMMWVHFRDLLVSDRRMLVPNYARRQIPAFVTLAALLVIAPPWAVVLRRHMPRRVRANWLVGADRIASAHSDLAHRVDSRCCRSHGDTLRQLF